MTPLHKKNLLLPEVERISVNLKEIDICLDEIVADSHEIVDNRLLEQCLRLVSTRRMVKYIPNWNVLTRTVNVFHELLMKKRLSIVMKIKLLEEMQKICRKAKVVGRNRW